MTLRHKILLIFGATLVSLNLVLYAASSTILLNRFSKLEKQRVRQNVERVMEALANEQNQLNSTAQDWAPWDETYSFIEDNNKRYIKANLDDQTFGNLRLNIMLFLNANGQVVFSKGFDLQNYKAEPVPQNILNYIRAYPALLDHQNFKSCYTGIVMLSEGSAEYSQTSEKNTKELPILIASCPILTNKYEGPIRGTLIIGRYLDRVQIQRLAQQTEFSISSYQPEKEIPKDEESGYILNVNDLKLPLINSLKTQGECHELNASCLITVQSLNADAIAGYAKIKDLYGKESLLLRVELPRDIYKQGQASLRYFIWSLLIGGAIFGLVGLIVLEKLILCRLAALSAGVKLIGSSGNLSQHLRIPGSDELSSLAKTINGMLTQLDLSHTALRESEAKFRVVSEATPIPVVITRASDGVPLYLNEYTAITFGLDREELLHHKTSEFYYDLAEREALLEAFICQGYLRNYEVRAKKADGSPFWVSASLEALMFNGEAAILSAFFDISDRKQIEQALFQEKELAQVTLQSIGDGAIATNAQGEVQSLNPVAEILTGWQTEEAKGQPLSEVFQLVNETTREVVENPVTAVFRENRIISTATNMVLIAKDGREFAIDHSAAPIYASSGQIMGAILVFRNVTQARNLSHQLTWQATHDRLTRLINRHEFERLLEEAVASSKILNKQHVLCYLDLDKFKIINDTCGHAAGDELLRQVTALLKSKVQGTDILARLGGDEFGLLLYKSSINRAVEVADSLRNQIQNFRFAWEGKTFTISVSIGLVAIGSNDVDMACHVGSANVLSAADAACYAAKSKGCNRLHIYKADDSDMARQFGETQWVGRINQALEENRFCLYSQTIAPLAEDCIGEIHCEILLRMLDETGEIVSPASFMPAAERYNLMPAIDRWVIRKLFSSLANSSLKIGDRKSNGKGKIANPKSIYAVNLSGASINDDTFIKFLQEQFTLYRVPPQIICFEITETVAIANLSKAVQFIQELKKLGCSFALDDFGSGMCSFAYLKNLPVDYLKIDGYFVKDIANDPIADAMVEAINRIGHIMGIKTIAEFVSSEAILERIKEIGVDYAQGYIITKPQPLTEIISNFVNKESKQINKAIHQYG
ncbi:EAL domain-containing protein [Kamptonema sp. UHCC 0994]|uniref:EAL domain-containing protein n=1 Tax=Kamptonema sp. UHCC 0994 TaxID=3031329 RepID=UPI0023B92D95|nr:EAL domain-containing protein [Kamptonema sp. UHCC 0994]MDF0555785.1 EAL domain-containing protein [Kamptonema sp. UHCC 0994]